MQRILTTAAISAVIAISVQTADAQTKRAWANEQSIMVDVDGSDPGREHDFRSFLLKTSARGGTTPIVTLSCQVNSKGVEMFNAAIQLDPENTYGPRDLPYDSTRFRHNHTG